MQGGDGCFDLNNSGNVHWSVLWSKKYKSLKNFRNTAQCSRYGDSLQAGRSGDRVQFGARFCAPVQTGPVAHAAFYTMGTGSFRGVKWPGRGVDHPLHLGPRLKKEQNYTSIPTRGLRGLFQGEISQKIRTFYMYLSLFYKTQSVTLPGTLSTDLQSKIRSGS